jgi:hypothetical protein
MAGLLSIVPAGLVKEGIRELAHSAAASDQLNYDQGNGAQKQYVNKAALVQQHPYRPCDGKQYGNHPQH